jgi:23S rRNA (cytosine1962-C5)-methyltransferase
MNPSRRPLWSRAALTAAVARRSGLSTSISVDAYRIVDGEGDGLPGLFIDRYGAVAVLNVYDDAGFSDDDVTAVARSAMDVLGPDGVGAVYVKSFVRDRSRLGGRVPDEARSRVPRVGTPQPEAIVVREGEVRFEVRPYDGLSTGLFLEHRQHRRALAERPAGRALNLFAYTCAFSVPLAKTGWHVTNVDVSGRYLDWGRRNHALNSLEAARVRFLRRDARAFLRAAAKRADERFDLVIIDPPTFGAVDHRRGIPAWRSVDDYPAIVRAAANVLAPGGVIFAATNTRELAAKGVLEHLVIEALGTTPRWHALPPWPLDVTERERVAAVLFERRT